MDDPQHSYQSAVDAVGLFAAFLITVIYLYLSRRASKAGGVPRANFSLGAYVIGWTASGMIGCLIGFVPSRGVGLDRLLHLVQGLEEAFALLWIVPMLSLWKAELKTGGLRDRIAILQTAVVITAAALFTLYLVSIAGPGPGLFPTYRATLFRAAFVCLTLPPLVAGFVALRRRTIAPVTRLALSMMLLGTLGLTGALVLRNILDDSPLVGALLNAVTVWCPLIIITGVIVLFARFRFADRFIRHCARIVSAATVGIATATFLSGSPHLLQGIGAITSSGFAVMVVGILTSALLVAYARFETYLNALVNRFVFPAPDYNSLVIAFQQDLLRLDEEGGVILASSDFIRRTLQMERVEAVGLSRYQCTLLSIPYINSTTPVTIDSRQAAMDHVPPGVEILAPFQLSPDSLEVLAVVPGAERRGLVTHEMKFIGVVASQLANRLQSIRHQRTLLESQSREAALQQQVIAAELQALRAQINPHFLFNALNTLADLIGVDAASAETMTLRLAQVFRYVLAHSSRSMVSVREEIDFLRSYLDIEEARFGDRLQVVFDIDPTVNLLPIPSLILQPIVENALKHGLSPKPGPGHLWIKACLCGDSLHITIADDGMGLRPAFPPPPPSSSNHGVGLSNIRRRLETQYPGQASLAVEPREPAGTCVSLILPVSTTTL